MFNLDEVKQLTKREKINVAQIGVGYWGPNLLRNLISNANCTVTKVLDLSKERQEFVKNLYPSVSVTTDINEIINDKNIQAVVISTPVKTHFEIAMRCLKAGKHILVEKPMATTGEEVSQISKVALDNKLVAMVGHTFLYNSAVRYIKKMINQNELGDLRYIYSQRVNLGRIRSDVDALWNLAPHDISIIQYWLDEPEPISIDTHGMDFVQKGIDDVVFMNIKYPKNIMANIHVSWLDPHKIRKMTIVGSEKMVVYDDISDNKITIYDKGIDIMAVLGENMDFDNSETVSFNHRSKDIVIPKINWQEPLKIEIEHFLSCIINDEKCISDSIHAKKVVDILSSGNLK